MPEGSPAPDDLLARLSDQIVHTRETAERLRSELAASRVSSRQTGTHASEQPAGAPPRGWAVPQPGPELTPGLDAQALAAALELARAVIPRELAQALAELVRELALVLRELLDAYLERAERRRAPPPAVEDIPLL